MKKIYLLILIVFCTNSIFAQETANEKKIRGGVAFNPLPNLKTVLNPATQAIIFSEDFGGGIPATWVVTDSAGNGEVWTVALGPKGLSVSPDDTLKSPTAANGIAIVDDDFYGNNNTVTSTSLITPAFDATGLSVVKVSFYDYFRMFNVGIDQGVLYVSNDGTTWVDVFHAETGLLQGDATPNPRFNDIDISAIAANQPTVYLNFTFRGDWGYWWQIDDIVVYEPDPIDGGVSVIDPILSGCLSATTPITITIANNGLNPVSNFDVHYTVNSGTPVTEMFTNTVASGATASYTFSTTTNLSNPGVYIITAYTTIPSDANTSNDSASISVQSFTSTPVVIGSPFAEGFENVSAANVPPTGWSTEDTDGDGIIWDFPNAFPHTGARAARMGFLTGVPVAPVAENWLFTPCLELMAGTNYTLSFWLKVFSVGVGDVPYSIEARIGTSPGSSAMTTTIVSPPNPVDTSYHLIQQNFTVPTNGSYHIGFNAYGNQPSTSTRIDDVSIDITTGINENNNSHLIQVYPNPSQGILYISNYIQNNDLKMEVVNNLGQVVLNLNNLRPGSNQVDLTGVATGIYTLRFIGEKEIIIKKISLQNN